MREYAACVDLSCSQTQDFDVIIVGSGAAGLYAALNLSPSLSCALLNKLGANESNSIYAQGGIAAVTLSDDTWQSHYEDTLLAGAGLCDKEAVKVLVKEGPSDIQNLIKLGVPFDKDDNDQVSTTLEGAHSCCRILHCGGDATGLHLAQTLISAAKQRPNLRFLDRIMLLDILTDENNRVSGVVAQDGDGCNLVLRAPYVIIASGGVGRVYRNSTNASCATGDGIASAMRAGAAVENMEFVQFHPTALIHPDLNMRYFLISEALRGEGAVLRNRKWEPFMDSVHPMSNLAPRDIVSRAIINEMKQSDLPNVYLDITSKPRDFLQKRFPTIYNECMNRGIDIAVNWIPVVPVQHYFMGGIKTDTDGKTNVLGLYACGESSCTGIHGANRLASNSLLECLVFGRRCAQSINASQPVAQSNARYLKNDKKPSEFVDFMTYRTQIRNNMTKRGGILRNQAELSQAYSIIEKFYHRLCGIDLASQVAVETLNMAAVSLSILKAASDRTESVGAHFRSDDPRQQG